MNNATWDDACRPIQIAKKNRGKKIFMIDSKSIAQLCVKIADDRKATNISVLHVEELFVITDYFVICSGKTNRHVQSIAQAIELEVKKQNLSCHHIEGYEDGKWILMDLGDIIVHIFEEEVRNYYELEDLWADAPRLNLSEEAGAVETNEV